MPSESAFQSASTGLTFVATCASAQTRLSRPSKRPIVWLVLMSFISAPIYAATTPTTTTLEIRPIEVKGGEPATLTAFVIANGHSVSPGIVTFCDASAPYCEDSAVLGTASITSNGTATLKKVFARGHYRIAAFFNGTITNAPSKSEPDFLDVYGKGLTTTTLSKSSAGDASGVQALVTGFGSERLDGRVSLIEDQHKYGRRAVPLGPSTLNTGLAPLVTYGATGILPSVSESAQGVVTGDFNGDGLPDVAVVFNYSVSFDSDAGALMIFLNDPAHPGQFIQGATYPLEAGAYNLVAGDFNRDGILDLVVDVVGESAGEYYLHDVLLLGDPQHPGQFVTTEITSATGFRVAADVNQDGALDLIGISGSNNVDILFGDPAHPGQFLEEKTYPAGDGAYSVAAADLNGDGVLDLAVSNYNYQNSSITVLLGDPVHPGQFLASEVYLTGAFTDPSAIAIGDFNRDGLPDIVTSLYGGSVDVFLNDPANPGKFLNPTEYGISGSFFRLALGSFYNKDAIDIAVIDHNYSPSVLPGDPDHPGQFLSPVNYPIPSGDYALGLFAGDFNVDGFDDLMLNLQGTNPVELGTLLSQVTQTATATFEQFSRDRPESGTVYAQYWGSSDYLRSRSGPIDLSVDIQKH